MIIECPSCRRRLKIAETALGSSVRCPLCQVVFLPGHAIEPEQIVGARKEPPKELVQPAKSPAATSASALNSETNNDVLRNTSGGGGSDIEALFLAAGLRHDPLTLSPPRTAATLSACKVAILVTVAILALDCVFALSTVFLHFDVWLNVSEARGGTVHLGYDRKLLFVVTLVHTLLVFATGISFAVWAAITSAHLWNMKWNSFPTIVAAIYLSASSIVWMYFMYTNVSRAIPTSTVAIVCLLVPIINLIIGCSTLRPIWKATGANMASHANDAVPTKGASVIRWLCILFVLIGVLFAFELYESRQYFTDIRVMQYRSATNYTDAGYFPVERRRANFTALEHGALLRMGAVFLQVPASILMIKFLLDIRNRIGSRLP